MAKSKKNRGTGTSPARVAALRPVEIYFAKYAESHQNPTNKLIHWLCVPLIVFSIFGLLWAIPFPRLKLLGAYNGYFNWASFAIAFSIYYYYKLSPVLSYFMLLILMIFSFGVIQLAGWQTGGGPALWKVCLILFALAWVGQFAGHRIEAKKPSFLDDMKFLLIGPIWLLHIILKKLSVKY